MEEKCVSDFGVNCLFIIKEGPTCIGYFSAKSRDEESIMIKSYVHADLTRALGVFSAAPKKRTVCFPS